MHTLRGRNSTSWTFVRGESHRGDVYTKGEKTFFMRKHFFYFVLLYTWFFTTLWCFELCLVFMLCWFHRIVFMCWTCIYPYVIVFYWLHVRTIICFAIWSLCSFPYDCFGVWSSYSYVSHHVYLIAFYLLHFICYIILVFLSLDLPWESNVFFASISGYRYTCSKFITAFRFRCEWVLPLFSNSRLSLKSVIGCFVTE